MRSFLILTLIAALAVPTEARGRRRAAASPSERDDVSITFTGVSGNGSDAIVDAGAISQKRNRQTFGVRIDGKASGGTATLRASLESHDGRSKVFIDGIVLTTVPKVIIANAPLGTVTTHTLEIEVDPTVAEGAFASSVRWEATTNE